MTAYATIEDIQNRIMRDLSSEEQDVCGTFLDDAAVIIDSYNSQADQEAKKVVSCRMVIRSIGSDNSGVPVGATQGSSSGLGYTSSWTVGSGGAVGELYLSKLDKKLLGYGNKIGSHSPVEDLRTEDII